MDVESRCCVWESFVEFSSLVCLVAMMGCGLWVVCLLWFVESCRCGVLLLWFEFVGSDMMGGLPLPLSLVWMMCESDRD